MSAQSCQSSEEQKFDEYVDALAAAMNHPQQKERLHGYCSGLLLPGERKSMEPIAAHLDPDRVQAMHHSVQHFITEGTWSDEAVLARVREQVLPALHEHGAIRFWIVDESGLPKKGRHSVGVARQYCGELGKVDNCQVMVSLSVANDVACLPIAARLYLPEAWAGDFARRDTVHVPLDIRFQTKPAIALEQIRQAQAAGVAAGVVLGDEVYGGNPTFRQGVTALGLPYAVAVPATTRVCPPRDGRRARRWRRHAKPVLTVRDAAGRLPRSAWRWVTWREGSAADLTGRFAMIRIGVAPDGDGVAREGEQTLLVEWPVGERDPIGYWLVTLPATTPLNTVVATAKGRWGIEQNYRDLKQEVGLGAFEGRSWRGFHHHVTLCIAAYGYLMLCRCRTMPLAGGRAAAPSFPHVIDPREPPVRPERHNPHSIATQRRRLIIHLARRLPRCPCCHTRKYQMAKITQPEMSLQ